MAPVDKGEVVKFIKEHALTESPENLFKQVGCVGTVVWVTVVGGSILN